MATKHIFVVEDREPLLSLLRTVLEEEQYAVSGRREGREALREIVAEPPDLVILDLRLNDMSGRDILEMLRDHADGGAIAQVPVIVATAAALEADTLTQVIARNPARYANVSVLQKPFELDDLLLRVRQALGEQVDV
jgi:two-component system KDP operon response regulator KdpE